MGKMCSFKEKLKMIKLHKLIEECSHRKNITNLDVKIAYSGSIFVYVDLIYSIKTVIIVIIDNFVLK